jgi:hypothetical protein
LGATDGSRRARFRDLVMPLVDRRTSWPSEAYGPQRLEIPLSMPEMNRRCRKK